MALQATVTEHWNRVARQARLSPRLGETPRQRWRRGWRCARLTAKQGQYWPMWPAAACLLDRPHRASGYRHFIYMSDDAQLLRGMVAKWATMPLSPKLRSDRGEFLPHGGARG